MVNGGPHQLMSERAVFHGSSYCFQLQGQGSFILSIGGLEIRRRNKTHQTIRCKLRNGERDNVPLGQKKKRRVADISISTNLQAPEFGILTDERGPSQPAASPASDMDILDEHENEFEEEDENDELSRYRGLVLDVAYRPINVVNWKRALVLDILEKADVLEFYDQVVYSPNRMFFIPAVLKVNSFVHTPKHQQVRLSLSRSNIFMRDKYKCQYCDSQENLTIDHVSAASRGGGWTWENLVTACSPCNVKKASKTLEEAHMTLAKIPKEPKILNSYNLPPNYKTFRTLKYREGIPSEWLSYLPNRMPRVL